MTLTTLAHVVFNSLKQTNKVQQRRNNRELKQRRRQRKRHPKNFMRLFKLAQLLQKMANYQGTQLVGVSYMLRKKMKNSLACVHVLHKTLNVVISRCGFAEDGKEMYQNVKRTCRAIVFAH